MPLPSCLSFGKCGDKNIRTLDCSVYEIINEQSLQRVPKRFGTSPIIGGLCPGAKTLCG